MNPKNYSLLDQQLAESGLQMSIAPAAAVGIQLGLAAIGTGIGMMGAKQSSDAQKKAVEEQYKYDKKLANYNWQNAKDLYQFEQNEVNIARDNNEAELAYREAVDKQNYKQQLQQRRDVYKGQVEAYRQSEQDYKDYVGLNQMIAQQAKAETRNKFNDQKAALSFANEGARYDELDQMNALRTQMQAGRNQFKDAKADARLANKRNQNAYDQTVRSANLNDRRTQVSINEANRKKLLATQDTEFGKDRARLTRDMAIRSQNDAIQSGRLAKNQSIERNNFARDSSNKRLDQTFLEQKLQNSQRKDEIKAAFVTDKLQLTFSDENARFALSETKLAEQQQRQDIRAGYKRTELGRNQTKDALTASETSDLLSNTFGKEQAELTLTGQKLNEAQNRADIKDTYSDQELSKVQSVDELTDAERYQLFEQSGRIEDLKGEQRLLKLQHDADMAARAFEQEAATIQGLQAQGAQAARGQRGNSASRNIASAIAATGRQQAQLADSILRGKGIYTENKSNIQAKISRAEDLMEMYKASTTRKKGDLQETLDRQRIDKEREIGQSEAQDLQREAERDLAISQADRKATDIKTNTTRQKDDQDELLALDLADRERELQQSRDRRDKAIEKKDLKIDQNRRDLDDKRANRDRRVEDVNETQRMQKQRRDLEKTINNDQAAMLNSQARATFQLNKSQAETQKSFARTAFTNAKNQLNNDQKQLMNSLNASLKQYGLDLRGNKQTRKAAMEDFKTNQQGAQNTFNSAQRQFGLTNADINRQKVIDKANSDLRKREYQASLQSARNARGFAMQQIALDKYSANLTADKARLSKPEIAPKPPKPIKYPRTIYQDPRQPQKPPAPIKGTSGGGQVLTALAGGLGRMSGINFGAFSPGD